MKFFLFCALSFLLGSCTVNYSFTGASYSPDTKSFSVAYIQNTASFVQPSLSNELTNALKDIFQAQTGLNMQSKGGDLSIEGRITGYTQTYSGEQANETAARNKLIVTVQIKFTNKKEPAKSFERSFSQFEEYLPTQKLSAVEGELLKKITERLADDIFRAAVANW